MKDYRNQYGVKDASDCYRNINGVKFIHWTGDWSIITPLKPLLKTNKIKHRIIGSDLYVDSTKTEAVVRLEKEATK